ncbi:Hypothetical_protein [Hexamita inflata]|uniref:Hypothetical_protein n=1 Tax=Hexamita inflata TaxID=28002 RepID=A0ABP1LM81_9EUKA
MPKAQIFVLSSEYKTEPVASITKIFPVSFFKSLNTLFISSYNVKQPLTLGIPRTDLLREIKGFVKNDYPLMKLIRNFQLVPSILLLSCSLFTISLLFGFVENTKYQVPYNLAISVHIRFTTFQSLFVPISFSTNVFYSNKFAIFISSPDIQLCPKYTPYILGLSNKYSKPCTYLAK